MISAAILSAILSLAPPSGRGLTFDTTLKSVAVFRDGYGYYVREGKVKLEDGWATTNFVPNAIKGTIWVYSLDKGDRIDTVITTKDNKISFSDAKDLKAKLSDKIGLKLNVELTDGQKFEGELARLLDDMLLLKAGSGFNAVSFSTIKAVQIVGYPIKVKVDSANPNKETTLGIAYLQEGIAWEPSYVLNIDSGKANLELRATMQNTTEELSKSDVLFVVGSPFVANRGLKDISGIVPEAATAAGKAISGGQGLVPESIPSVSYDKSDNSLVLGQQGGVTKAPVSGEEAGELYFYKKQGLSLETNDVAMVSIFQSDVPIQPQFEWNADGEEVLYLLSIQNTTKQPLTTGPVFVIEDGNALGQETVKYTPPGSTAEVRLSRGIGLRVEKTEAEVKRGGPVHIGKSDFIPVTLKGTLTVTNFRTSDARLKITKTARGKVLSQSDGGAVKQTQVLSGEVNPINDLEWKVTVPKGATKVITYTLETYIFADRSGTPPVPATPGEND